MSIIISPDKKLSQIQVEFHQKFPFLKLVFFRKPHEAHEGSSAKDIISPDQTIEEAGHFDGHTEMSIDGHTHVATLETDFQNHYGIGVQVFRRSGGTWLLTAETDDWSLAEQNDAGKQDSAEIAGSETPAYDDFREQE